MLARKQFIHLKNVAYRRMDRYVITRSLCSSHFTFQKQKENIVEGESKQGHHGRQSKVDIGEAAGIGRVGISTDFMPTGDMKDSSMDKSGTVNVNLARKSGMQSTGVGLDDSVWPNTIDDSSEKDVDLSSLRGPDRQPGLEQLKKKMGQKADVQSQQKSDSKK